MHYVRVRVARAHKPACVNGMDAASWRGICFGTARLSLNHDLTYIGPSLYTYTRSLYVGAYLLYH